MRLKMHKIITFNRVIVFLGVVIFVLGGLFFAKVVPAENHKSEKAVAYDQGWYYIQGKEKIHISLPCI